VQAQHAGAYRVVLANAVGSVTSQVAMLTVRVELDLVSDTSWRCSEVEQSGWQDLGFDDSAWGSAVVRAGYPYPPDGSIPGTLGQHIWSPGGATTVHFRKSFMVSGTRQISQAIVRVDDAYDFYVNGLLVGFKHEVLPPVAQTYDITPYLQRDVNVFAIKAWDLITIDRARLFDADVRYVEGPSPRLEVMRSNQGVIVSWKIPAEVWNLEYSTVLTPFPSTWVLIPPPYPTKHHPLHRHRTDASREQILSVAQTVKDEANGAPVAQLT
jgi:hypothetical protein